MTRLLCSFVAGLALVTACKKDPPRLYSRNAEHLTPAALPATPAIDAEVYVAVYSNLSYFEGREAVELSAQLTIRNTDEFSPIILESVRYFDGSGRLLRSEIAGPQLLPPMATTSFFVRKRDTEGGAGANYMVRWRSEKEVSEPLLEVVMADVSASFALAFVSRGVTTRSSRGTVLVPPTP